MALFDKFWSAAVFVTCMLGVIRVGAAAEIRLDPSHGTTEGAVLEGEIEKGDFDKFKQFILNGNNAVEIYLASPGGDLGEAMKIGLLARILKLSTVVPSKALTNESRRFGAARHNLKHPRDNVCASACFFVFVGGIHRRYDDQGPAVLGIHRPTLSQSDLKRLDPDQASAVDERARTVVDRFLKVMDVPAKYAEEMYSVPHSRVRWIRNDEFDADFAGFIPEFRDLVRARCDSPIDGEEQARKKSKILVEQTCETKVQDELALRAYDDALKGRNREIPQSTFNRMPPK